MPKQLIVKFISIVSLIYASIGYAETQQSVLDIQHWTTKNGARVYFTPTNQVPIIDLTIAFDAGSNRDGDQEGLAQLSNTLLSQGSGDYNATEIAEQFENIGARFSSSLARNMASFSLRSLTDENYLQQALNTFALVVASPQLSDTAIAREKQRQIATIAARAQSANNIAQDAFFKAAFKNTPYATPSIGNKTSIEEINTKDIQNFYQRYYVAKNAVIAIVGAINIEQAKQIAENISRKIPSGEKASAITIQTEKNQGEMQHISFPSNQTAVLIGKAAISYHSPDFYALRVANYTLGGDGMKSKLAQEIREKHGYTYSIYSSFIPMQNTGAFIVNFATKKTQANEAIKKAEDILSEYLNKGPNEKELIKAKQNLSGNFILRFENNRKILGLLVAMGHYQLPIDYLDTYVDKINAVSKQTIIEALKRHLTLDNMVTIRVG